MGLQVNSNLSPSKIYIYIKCQIPNHLLVIPGHFRQNPGKKKKMTFFSHIPGKFQANSRQIPGQSQVIYDLWVESDIILEVLKELHVCHIRKVKVLVLCKLGER